MSTRVHKAFESIIKVGYSASIRKKIYSELDVLRGKVLPRLHTNRIVMPEVVIDETLKSYNDSSWAKDFCSANSLQAPLDHTRLSACKKKPNLQTSAMNLHTHKVKIEANGKAVEKTIIRGGAPCTHKKKTTESLIVKIEKSLGITPKTAQSTYERVMRIKSFTSLLSPSLKIQDLMSELELRMDSATAQMIARLQAAYDSQTTAQKHKTGPFIHFEMSLLSPGNKKERSMVMDSDMAMENLSRNYKIVTGKNGKSKIQKSTLGRSIKIVLSQMAINEHQITDNLVQEYINLRACRNLREIIESRNGLSKKSKTITQGLLKEIENRTTSPDRPYTDEVIIHKFHKVVALLGITSGIFCKSGKDRTAQGVIDCALEELDTGALNIKKKSRKALQQGLSLYITGANTGNSNGYSFNSLQLEMIPESLRADIEDCNTTANT